MRACLPKRFCGENGFSPLVLVAILGTLILLVGIVVVLSGRKSQPNQTDQNTSQQENVLTAPQVQFGSYKNNAPTPTIPQTVPTYTVRSTFPKEFTQSFAARLDLTKLDGNKTPWATYSRMDDPIKRGALSFNTVTGAFEYVSWGMLRPHGYSSGQPITQTAQQMVGDLGFNTKLVTCDVTYKKQDVPNQTFVECHYSWDKLGLPLDSLAGLVNMSETEMVAAMTPGKGGQLMPTDKTVYDVSTGENGKARPNDFNTITFGINTNGAVQSITSNLRFISASKPETARNLLQPQEALKLYGTNPSTISITLPAGEGYTDLAKVYPNNNAQAQVATINDYQLVYLENLPTNGQKTYAPTYIIRGTAKLASGYVVKYVQALPAQKTASAYQTHLPARVASKVVELAQIRLGGFDPSTSPTTPEPTTPASSAPPQATSLATTAPTTQPTPTPPPAQACDKFDPSTTKTFDVPGYGQLTVGYADAHTFFFAKSDFATNDDMAKVKDAFFKVVEEQYLINIAKRLGTNTTNAATADVIAKFNEWQQADMVCLTTTGCRTEIPYTNFSSFLPRERLEVLNTSRAEAVRNSAAQRTVEMIQQNKVGQYASKSDLFAEGTLVGLYAVFYANDASAHSSTVVGAACYISGGSPVLFIYSDKEQILTIKPASKLTYAEPGMTTLGWTIQTKSNGTIGDAANPQVVRDSLYYEYDKQSLTVPSSNIGVSLPADEIEQYVKDVLAQQLALNDKETASLYTEVVNALADLPKKQYVSLKPISRDVIDQQLPLLISPQPQSLFRFHLAVTTTDTPELLTPPNLPVVNRAGYTIVELGAIAK